MNKNSQDTLKEGHDGENNLINVKIYYKVSIHKM